MSAFCNSTKNIDPPNNQELHKAVVYYMFTQKKETEDADIYPKRPGKLFLFLGVLNQLQAGYINQFDSAEHDQSLTRIE